MISARQILPVFVPHLGCPNQCVFCDQRQISGQKQAVSKDTVRAAIEHFRAVSDISRPSELAFYGGSFTAIPQEKQEELSTAALPFLHLNPQNTIRISTRPDCIGNEDINRLKRFGVKTVELGCQSLCDDVLCSSRRGHNARVCLQSAERLKQAGFFVILQMMTGLPGDTPEKSIFTARQICRIHPDGVRVYPTVIIQHTPLYDLWKQGYYTEHTVNQAVALCAEIYSIFHEAGIPIIRMGLNPSDELTQSSVAGGAYHPAFGQLVYSRVYLNRLLQMLPANVAGKRLHIIVSKGKQSLMIGQKKCNIDYLMKHFGFSKVSVTEEAIAEDDIQFFLIEKQRKK